MGRKLTREEAIGRHKAIHGDKFSYDETEYLGAKTKWKLWCNDCEKSFWQKPNNGISGKQGCPNCYKLTTEEWIECHKEIHKDKYSYHLAVYKGALTKWELWCNDCEKSFWQTPNSGISGKSGCPYCFGNIKLTKDEAINKHKDIHSDKYLYHLVEYVNSATKWELWCNTCEKSFWQTPVSGISGKQGCPYCGVKNQVLSRTLSQEQSIQKHKSIHGEKYSYHLAVYKGAVVKWELWCNTCEKSFWQTPNNGISQKSGCPNCRTSYIERQIQDYVKSIYFGKIIFNTYDIIKPFECDIYIPALALVIEVNGWYWHMDPTKYLPHDYNDSINKSAQEIWDKDKLKRQMLKDKGIRLLSIWERQYHNNTTDMERIIFNAIYSITDDRYTFSPQARELFNINL